MSIVACISHPSSTKAFRMLMRSMRDWTSLRPLLSFIQGRPTGLLGLQDCLNEVLACKLELVSDLRDFPVLVFDLADENRSHSVNDPLWRANESQFEAAIQRHDKKRTMWEGSGRLSDWHAGQPQRTFQSSTKRKNEQKRVSLSEEELEASAAAARRQFAPWRATRRAHINAEAGTEYIPSPIHGYLRSISANVDATEYTYSPFELDFMAAVEDFLRLWQLSDDRPPAQNSDVPGFQTAKQLLWHP